MKRLKNKRRKNIRHKLIDLQDKILIMSSQLHILDAIIDSKGLSDEELSEHSSVMVIHKLANRVKYLQQEALHILGESVPIRDSGEGQDSADDGTEGLSDESDDLAD